jgi:hypothetical protein
MGHAWHKYLVIVGHFVIYVAILIYALFYLRRTELDIEVEYLETVHIRYQYAFTRFTRPVHVGTMQGWSCIFLKNETCNVNSMIVPLYDCTSNAEMLSYQTVLFTNGTTSTERIVGATVQNPTFVAFQDGVMGSMCDAACDDGSPSCYFQFTDDMNKVQISLLNNMHSSNRYSISKEEIVGATKTKNLYFVSGMEIGIQGNQSWSLLLGTRSIESLTVVYDIREVIYLSSLIAIVSVELAFELYMNWKEEREIEEELKPLYNNRRSLQ